MTDVLALLPRAIAVVAPHADVPAWVAALYPAMRSYGITTDREVAAFVGQCAVESEYFEALVEDTYYLTAEHIREVFPTHFADQGEAAPYIGHSIDLANFVYANRNGNGDVESGDGWRYRGRGLIQITGRANYAAVAKVDQRAKDPNWLATIPGAAASACWFWSTNHLNPLADTWDIEGATRRINGPAMEGAAARLIACNAALAALGGAVTASPAPVESVADQLMDRYNPGA